MRHGTFDADLVLQREDQSVGQHDETCGDAAAIQERDLLVVVAGGEAEGLGIDARDARRNGSPHGVNQVVIQKLRRLGVERSSLGMEPSSFARESSAARAA